MPRTSPSVVNSITGLSERYGVHGEGATILLFSTHPLAIIADDEKFDSQRLVAFIQKHRVSLYIPKRMILVVKNLTDARYGALRRGYKERIFNEYGFTESAFVTALKMFKLDSTRTNMSLAQPVRAVKCYILDTRLRRVPSALLASYTFGGLGISRGYMNREELTRERFLANLY
ncbi:hypothetical protein BBP40_005423 [Aspergillus hancockii]|nr:hypothetical protein BBP40_005423 [Aspergillus hancockii]